MGEQAEPAVLKTGPADGACAFAYAAGGLGEINGYLVDAFGRMSPSETYGCRAGVTWLARAASGGVLYVASTEIDPDDPGGEGWISTFAIDQMDGRLGLINSVRSGGSNPAHISLHPSGHWLLVANYGVKGNASGAVLSIASDGSVGALADRVDFEHPRDIWDKAAADAPPRSFAVSGHDRIHNHHFEADPSGRFALLTELATDRIYVYDFDAKTGKISPTDQGSVAATGGAGPRTIAFHANGNWIYAANEEASTVSFMILDSHSGALTHQQTLQTLPDDFEGSNFASHVEVSPNGDYVWVLNRLHDSIAIFKVGATGQLARIGEAWTRGSYPFHIAVDPAGSFIFVSHLRSDNVTVFRIIDGGADFEMAGYCGVRQARCVSVGALVSRHPGTQAESAFL